MTKEDYDIEITGHWTHCKIWSITLLLVTGLFGLVVLKYNIVLNTFWYIYCIILVLCLHMIISNIQEVRYKSLALARLIEKEKFESKLREANIKFYQIFDNMCYDNNNLKEMIPCRDLFAPIIPSSTVKLWERDPNHSNKIIGFWAEDCTPYEIVCPAQLRDIIVKLQNSL